jgi:hypothetical protein
MNEQDLDQARTSVESILSALNITRVVYVDDANDGDVSLEDVIVAAAGLDASHLLEAFPELGSPVPDDADVLGKKVRTTWIQLDSMTRAKRGMNVLVASRRQDGDNADDIADASILSDLVPPTKLMSLTPEQWNEQKDRLLQDIQNQRTLFLFDRRFTKAEDDNEGIKIIASLLDGDNTRSLMCGLLTHTVTPDTQPQQWEDLSRAYNIPKDRFVVIPKLHLSQAPILFAQALKFVALSPDFAKLKDTTKDIIAKAVARAAERVEKVSIYDLDHIVFQLSADEGLWEPDMLFRLHALFHHLESRQLAYADGTLEEIAAKMRTVSEIPTDCKQFTPPSNAWTLQHEELYEAVDYINRNYLPLDLGDIFERLDTTSPKRYILLAQPCDLMVRHDGKRHPELYRLPLAEIVMDANAKAPHYSEEMPYFSTSSMEKWYVKLKQVHFIRGCILDLCVFNQDGVARLNINKSGPPSIRPSWKLRYKLVSDSWNRAIRKADGMLDPLATDPSAVKQFKQNHAKEIEALIYGDDLFKGSIKKTDENRTLEFNCKRIGRLSRVRAMGLLMSYTATIGRSAYEREFVNRKLETD